MIRTRARRFFIFEKSISSQIIIYSVKYCNFKTLSPCTHTDARMCALMQWVYALCIHVCTNKGHACAFAPKTRRCIYLLVKYIIYTQIYTDTRRCLSAQNLYDV